MAGALKKVGNHVQDALGKIREKPWAEPLGQGLAVGAKIVGSMEGFVPGLGILGGAMSFGASLLNPEPTLSELKDELIEIKQLLQDDSMKNTMVKALERQQKELEEKIENPVGEIRSNFAEVKKDMKELLYKVEKENLDLSDELSRMKDKIHQTFLLVADTRYKVRLCH